MKYSVYNNPMQLIIYIHTILLCIFLYSFYTNYNITRNKIPRNIIERYYISIRIMIKILLIYPEQIFIITK